MKPEVIKALESGRMDGKYPSFAIQGNETVPADKRMHFLLSNDTFISNAIAENFASNTRLLAELFNYEVGLDSYLREFSKAVFDNEFDHYERTFTKYTAAQWLFQAIGHHKGSSVHLSAVNCSRLGDFATWYNIKTGEIRGWTGSYSKWVSSEEIYEDLLAIAKNCPYVDMTVTLFDGKDSDDEWKATASIRIAGGELSAVETLPTGFTSDNTNCFYANDIFDKPLPKEMGVDQATFNQITQCVKELIKDNTAKAIELCLRESC